jgi:hypothetical protein
MASSSNNSPQSDPWESAAPGGAPTPSDPWEAPAQPLTPQATGWQRYLLGGGSQLLSGLEQGVGGIGDIYALGRSLEDKYLPGGVASALQTAQSAVNPLDTEMTPTTKDFSSITDPAGFTNNPAYEPTGIAERTAAGALRGIGAAIPALATGDPLLMLGSGAASGAASQDAADALPGNKWAPVVAGLVTGIGTGTAGGLASHAIDSLSAARASTQADNDVAAAQAAVDALKANASPEAKAAAQSQLLYAKQKAQEQFDAAKDTSESSRDALIAQAGQNSVKQQAAASQAIGSIAALHSPVQSYQDAGEAIQDAGRQWLNSTMPAKQQAAWDAVQVDPSTPTPLNNFRSALESIQAKAGPWAALEQQLKPTLPAKLLSTLDRVAGEGGAEGRPGVDLGVEGVEPIGANPGTWQDARQLRTTLGAAMSNPKVVADVGSQELKHLYSGLTADLGETAAGAGQASQFAAANAESQRLYQIAEGPLSKVIGGKVADPRYDPDPGKVAKSLLSGGQTSSRDLAALTTEIPEIGGHLVAAQLREDPQGWNKLSDSTQQTLMPNPGHHQITSSALQLQQTAPQAEKAAIAAAKAAHSEHIADLAATHKQTLDQLTAGARSADVWQRQAQFEANQALSSARGTQAAARQRQLDLTAGGVNRLTGGGSLAAAGLLPAWIKGGLIGDTLGGAAEHLIAGMGIDPHMTAMMGAAAPLIAHGMYNAVKNPFGLRAPIVGLEAGESANNQKSNQ